MHQVKGKDGKYYHTFDCETEICKKDAELLNRLLNDIYPWLPTDFKLEEGKQPINFRKLLEEVPFGFEYELAYVTQKYLGFGPEDAPDWGRHIEEAKEIIAQAKKEGRGKNAYKELLCSEKRPWGAKVKLTLKLQQALNLVYEIIDAKTAEKEKELGRKLNCDELKEIKRGRLNHSLDIIAHELFHAKYNSHNPLRNIQSEYEKLQEIYKDDYLKITDTLLSDEERVKDHYAKITEDEYGACWLDDIIAAPNAKEQLAYRDEFIAYRKANPHEFEEGGKYRLLAPDMPNPYEDYYLKARLEPYNGVKDFNGKSRYTYKGQLFPVLDVIKLIEINKGKEGKYKDYPPNVIKEMVKGIIKNQLIYMSPEHTMENSFSQLQAMRKRFNYETSNWKYEKDMPWQDMVSQVKKEIEGKMTGI